MKVERIEVKEEVKFKPITLQVTIESEEELKYLREVAFTNLSVPNAVNKANKHDNFDCVIHDKVFEALKAYL